MLSVGEMQSEKLKEKDLYKEDEKDGLRKRESRIGETKERERKKGTVREGDLQRNSSKQSTQDCIRVKKPQNVTDRFAPALFIHM